LKVGY